MLSTQFNRGAARGTPECHWDSGGWTFGVLRMRDALELVQGWPLMEKEASGNDTAHLSWEIVSRPSLCVTPQHRPREPPQEGPQEKEHPGGDGKPRDRRPRQEPRSRSRAPSGPRRTAPCVAGWPTVRMPLARRKHRFSLAFSALSSPSPARNGLNAGFHGLMENFTLMQSIT